MSAIIVPDQDDLVPDIPDLNVSGAPAEANANPPHQQNEGVPNHVDAEAAAEAAEEQANALRPEANPHEFVTMRTILRSEPFAGMVVSIPIALSLLVALVADSSHSCEVEAYQTRFTRSTNISSSSEDYGDPPPIKGWAITCVVLNLLMVVVDGILTRLFIKNPATPTNGDRRWGLTIIISRFLDLCWFIWFIVGAVWTFKLAKHPCHFELPFIYNVCMAIVVFTFVSLGAALLACCIACTLICAGLGFMIRHQQNNQGGVQNPEEEVSHGASEEEIDDLPVKTFHEGMIDAPEATCSICFGDYIPGEELRFLPCHHHFHAECVDSWFTNSRACPICKHPINKPAPETAYNPESVEGINSSSSEAVPVAREDSPSNEENEGSPFAHREDPNMGTFVNMN